MTKWVTIRILEHRFKQANVILLTVLSVFALPAHAYTLQSHAEIHEAVNAFISKQDIPLKNVQVSVTSLNAQIRVAQCPKALKVASAPGSKLMGYTSLSVSCPASKYINSWKIHVAAHVDGVVDTLVARYPISRGSIIRESDLQFASRRYSQLNHGYYSNPQTLVNKEAKRNLKMGKVITPQLVKEPKLVLRGQHVTIIAQKGHLNLRVKGKALMDGQQGQTIKVSNLKSKKLIYARVISAGTVEVIF
ncbi:MAG: flagellar basal body P-ring formation chaperone FlgA [Woeseiaceae bacterium]